MRHPSAAIKEGDLSRLTTSSSSTSSGNNGSFFIPDCGDALTTSTLNCSYLPEVIDPLEWQSVSRKRKERQDSTSSTTQDRKLIRSNSEEYIPNVDYEVIRRVFSHEEFKNPLKDKTNTNSVPSLGNCKQTLHPIQCDTNSEKISSNTEIQDILNETHKRAEISPARSRTFDYSHKYRISPHRDGIGRSNGGGSGCSRYASGGGDEIEGENERRRTSERFCKARAQPGRKQHSSKKPSKYLASRLRGGRDENVYRYDKAFTKSERRGFTSQYKNDDITTLTKKDKSIDDEETEYHPKSWALPLQNDNKVSSDAIAVSRSPKQKRKHETHPWDKTFQNDTPVVCPRFSDSTFDHVNHSRNNTTGNNHLPPTSSNNGLSALGHLTKVENNKTREIMQSLKSPNVFTTSDEKLKQITKRLTALKKRASLFEETFENENGFRPSQADKSNDRYFKGILTEIHKLRKDKQQLKSDTTGQAVRFNKLNNFSNVSVNRVGQMNETLLEIEKRLREKRTEENRSFELNQLSTDQLVQEKTAVQRALLYFESLFGRPNSREERDSVRFLYDRYRAIKRSLNRSASLTSSGFGGIGDLPTIHEHEAMQFIGKDAHSSVDTSSMTLPLTDKSPISASAISTDSTETTSSIHENVHQLSLSELWKQLEIAREGKRELRRTIKEFEEVFEKQNGRRMLKSDRFIIEETYGLYKQKKAKLRLLDALVKKNMVK